jgi:hypothetical protein
MPQKSFSAGERFPQAPQPNTYDKAADVAAFIARHGVTHCPTGARTEKPKKPVSAKAQRWNRLSKRQKRRAQRWAEIQQRQAKKRKLHNQCWTVRRSVWKRKTMEELQAWIQGKPIE